MQSRLLPLFSAAVVLFSTLTTHAENWPGWRGPRGDGTSLEGSVPISWDAVEGDNVAWKAPIPGVGHASPIIWKDRVLTVSCLLDTQERILICLDRRTGKPLWQKTVFKAPLETRHNLNSHASGTPATDGKLIYVAFLKVDGRTVPAPNVGRPRPITPGEIIVAAYDFEGSQRWSVSVGEFVSAHGFCSCPVLYKDMVIINGDHDGKSYIVALKKATGEQVWKVPRKHGIRSYVTPIIRDVAGKTQMVVSGSQSIVSFNPDNGSQHWNIEGPTEQYVASMVFDGEKFYMAAGFPTHHVVAVKPDGKGDVTDTHIAWHTRKAACYVPSPVLVKNNLFVVDDRGTGNIFDTDSGERIWQGRLGKHYSTSLVTAGGLVYCVADDGITKVVRPGPEPEIVSENPLGEYTYASPAISQGQLFVRGEKHLFAIGKAKTETASTR